MKSLALPSAILSTLLQPSAVAAAVTSPLKSAGSVDHPIHVEPVEYTDAEGAPLNGFISFADNDDHDNHNHKRRSRGLEGDKVPAVIILHDASGPDDYEKQRATIISHDYGFVGFAADIYGPNAPPAGADWATSMPFTAALTGNATLFSQRIQAAVDYVQALEEVDATKVAIIGYCMGGTGVVHYLNMKGSKVDGQDPLAGAVAIHPSLGQGDGPMAGIDIPSLFLTGGADFLTGPEAMATLEDDMKPAMAESDDGSWETVRYAGIGHGFSNWFSEGGYDERTDARSWYSQMAFLQNEFGSKVYETETPPEARVTEVAYNDGVTPGEGYVAMPENMEDGELLPAVIIVPDEGDRMYEKQRATQIADEFGYICFVADSTYAENHAGVQKALDVVKTMEGVDPTKIAVVGFGLGGTGAMQYGTGAFGTVDVDEGVKAVAIVHGDLNNIVSVAESLGAVPSTEAPAVPNWPQGGSDGDSDSEGDSSATTWPQGDTDGDASATTDYPASDSTTPGETRRRMEDVFNKPHILIQSGSDGDDMADVMTLEKTLVAMGANYELTRFSDAMGDWSVWDDDNYDAHATARSFDQLQTVLVEVFDGVRAKSGSGGGSGDGQVEESVEAEDSAASFMATRRVLAMAFAALLPMATLLF